MSAGVPTFLETIACPFLLHTVPVPSPFFRPVQRLVASLKEQVNVHTRITRLGDTYAGGQRKNLSGCLKFIPDFLEEVICLLLQLADGTVSQPDYQKLVPAKARHKVFPE